MCSRKRRRQSRRHAEVDQRELDVDVGRLRRGVALRVVLDARQRRDRRPLHVATVDRLHFRRRRRIRRVGEDDEHVPGMRIGVEVPVDRDLLEVRARQLVGDGVKIVLEARRAARWRRSSTRECARVVSTRSVVYASMTRGMRIRGNSASVRRKVAALRASMR